MLIAAKGGPVVDRADLRPDDARRVRGPAPRVLFLSSWVPRECGIATFARNLRASVHGVDDDLESAVLAIDEAGATREYGPEVIGRIRQDDPLSYRAAAAVATSWGADVVHVQHEFGLFGTPQPVGYSENLAGLLDALPVPAVVTLHTLPAEPAEWMCHHVAAIAERSAALVVMARRAADLLVSTYGVRRQAFVVPHGTPVFRGGEPETAKRALGLGGRPIISTFGLVNRGKGLEYAIDAVAELARRFGDIAYVIAGRTHPEIVRHEGESYRATLVDRVRALGLERHVLFVNEYLSLDAIGRLLSATDVYVTPYLDRDQITSGTLAYALGAGCPVVSTPYLHAIEALADGRGILVDCRSSGGLAQAVGRLLGDRELRREMAARARSYGRSTHWPAVGVQSARILREVVQASRSGRRIGATPALETAGLYRTSGSGAR